MKTIKPAANILFCIPKDDVAKAETRFLMTKEAAITPQIAEVMAVGDNVKYEIGELIVYKSYTTSDINLEGKDYFLINEEDVLGKVVEV